MPHVEIRTGFVQTPVIWIESSRLAVGEFLSARDPGALIERFSEGIRSLELQPATEPPGHSQIHRVIPGIESLDAGANHIEIGISTRATRREEGTSIRQDLRNRRIDVALSDQVDAARTYISRRQNRAEKLSLEVEVVLHRVNVVQIEDERFRQRSAAGKKRRANRERCDCGAWKSHGADKGQRAVGRLAIGAKERLLIKNAKAAAHRRLAVAGQSIGEPEAWRNSALRRLKEVAPYGDLPIGNIAQVGDLAVDLSGRVREFIAHAKIEREAWGDLEIVLREDAEKRLPESTPKVRSETRPFQISYPEANQISQRAEPHATAGAGFRTAIELKSLEQGARLYVMPAERDEEIVGDLKVVLKKQFRVGAISSDGAQTVHVDFAKELARNQNHIARRRRHQFPWGTAIEAEARFVDDVRADDLALLYSRHLLAVQRLVRKLREKAGKHLIRIIVQVTHKERIRIG